MVPENNKAGLDTPVLRDEDDRYGFVSVADGLATSLLALDGESGCVTGIEGRSPTGTHVLRFSPWLSGPGGSLAEALLPPVADIIRQEEEQRLMMSAWVTTARLQKNQGGMAVAGPKEKRRHPA